MRLKRSHAPSSKAPPRLLLLWLRLLLLVPPLVVAARAWKLKLYGGQWGKCMGYTARLACQSTRTPHNPHKNI